MKTTNQNNTNIMFKDPERHTYQGVSTDKSLQVTIPSPHKMMLAIRATRTSKDLRTDNKATVSFKH